MSGWCVDACPTSAKHCVFKNGTVTNENDNCEGYIPVPYDNTIDVMYRCIPNVKELLQSTSVYGSFSDFFTILVNDLQQAWWIFLVVLGLTVVFSVLFLCLVRFCSGCIVWSSIGLCVLVFFGVGLWIAIFGLVSHHRDPLRTDRTSAAVFVAFGFVFIAVAILIALLACCCLRRQIGLTAGVLSEASRALQDVWSVYLSPLFYLVLFGLAVAGFVTTLVYYCSGVDMDTTGGVKTLRLDTAQRGVIIAALIIFLWVVVFLVGCNQATIAGASSAWYFTRRKELLPSFAAGASGLTLFLHHLGSVAVGSFLITLLYVVRIIVLYIDRKMKEQGLKENAIVKCFCCCLNCCLGCMSRILEFITSNAYIVMSIYGTNFFSSASTAVGLLGRNPMRSLVLTSISRFAVVCLELCVTVLVTAVSIVILHPALLGIPGGVHVYYWWFMGFACFIFALALSVFAFHVYSFLIKVIFLSFLIDEELSRKNGGSYTHYASASLVSCMDDCAKLASSEDGTLHPSSYKSYSGSSGGSTPKPSSSAGYVDY